MLLLKKRNPSLIVFISGILMIAILYVFISFLVQRNIELRTNDQKLYDHVQTMHFIFNQYMINNGSSLASLKPKNLEKLKNYYYTYLENEGLSQFYIVYKNKGQWKILLHEPENSTIPAASIISNCIRIEDSLLTSSERVEDLYQEIQIGRERFRSLVLYYRNPGDPANEYMGDSIHYIGAQMPVLSRQRQREILLPSIIFALIFILLASIILSVYMKYSKKKELQIYREVFADQLTLLPNRNQLLNDLRYTKNPVLIIINVQSFKHINSFYGTEMGDFILISMANQISHLLKEMDHHLYRIQADEFSLLMDKKFFKSDLINLLQYISTGINEKTFSFQDHEINISTYIGVAVADRSEDEGIESGPLWQSILGQADVALRRSHDSHVPFVIYEKSMNIDEEVENNIKWTQTVKNAIKEERIIPYFQPIFNNTTRRIEKFECLARLLDENGKVIAPYHFLSIAKQTQLYHQITILIIKKSFEKFKDNNYEFSVNLSVKDILHTETRDYIIDLLNNNPRQARNLVFEIVESEGIEHIDIVTEFIYTVKKYGVKIAIDDFGSGYSNFANILKLKIDYIKIDASLIRNIDFDGNSQIITRSIIWFARELGLETISEYVHSEEVFEKACELGVDYSQGYFIGEPSPELNTD